MNASINQPVKRSWPFNNALPDIIETERLVQRKKLFNLFGNGHDLIVPVNTTVILGEGVLQPFKPLAIATKQVDTYKTWIGRPDELEDNHPWTMPENKWGGKRFNDKTQLSASEASDIERAGWIYLFNNSTKVADYAQAIEDYNGDFKASLYHIRRLIIQPGGSLLLRGEPAILLIDEMELQGTGKFYSYTACHVTVGHLKKTEQQLFVNN